MEKKYTPGPWKVKKQSPSQIGIRANSHFVAFLNYGALNPNLDVQQVANAHLIAAAPELYEAAQAVLKFIFDEYGSEEWVASHGDPVAPEARAVRDALAAALAKAEGEQQ